MDIDNKVCKKFTTEDSRSNVIVQMMDNEAKNVFNIRAREVAVDVEFNRLTAITGARRTDDSYTAHKLTDDFKKAVREACLNAIRDMVFGTGKSGKYAYVFQKRYMRQYKFNQSNDKVKDYWLRLKELNKYLPYFPINGASATGASPTKVLDDELKDWLDQNLPSPYTEMAKNNLFDILGSDIADVIEYLQTIESQIPKPKETSNTKKTLSSPASKKRKAGNNGGNKSKTGKCPHCSKFHQTSKGDYSDCFQLRDNKKSQLDGHSSKKARYTKKHHESSYKLMEGFQEMLEKASKKSGSSKTKERMM